MFTASKKIIITLLLGLAVLGAGVLGYVMIQKGVTPDILRGAILGSGGVATPALDPLLSGRACFSGGSNLLEVLPADETYIWSVTPPANVLMEEGTAFAPGFLIEAGGNQVRFMSPDPLDPNFATSYIVGVRPVDGVGGGDSFEIALGPPCVTALEFLTPSGTILADNGEITLTAVRAHLSNGDTLVYDASEIPRLGVAFLAVPAGADPRTSAPAPGFQFVDNQILVPTEHRATDIYMILRGNALEPVVFDHNNRIEGVEGNYILNSSEVDPDTVFVFSATEEGTLGELLAEGTDYAFVNGDPNADPPTNDFIRWLPPVGGPIDVTPPAALFVAYSYRPSNAVLYSEPLTIGTIQCDLLQANIFQGRGQGFPFDQPGVIASRGSVSEPFDFDPDAAPGEPPGTPPPPGIDSIVISNPIAAGATFGSAQFELRFDFVEALPQRAALVNQSGTNYEIDVRDEGAANRTGTASNFAYAVNTILGDNSPFVAYVDTTDNNRIILHSLEVGGHTNDYRCSRNLTAFTHSTYDVVADSTRVGRCFAGGLTGGPDADDDGTVDAGAQGLVTVDPPRPLDPILHQGETRSVYSRGGISDLTWRTSDASIFSVAPLSEAVPEEERIGDQHVILNAGSLGMADFDLPMPGSAIANTSNCVNDEDGNLQSCLVTIQAPVTFTPGTYSISIRPPTGDLILGTVQGAPVSGMLIGSATLNAMAGGPIALTGQMTLAVGGDAIGTIQATVNAGVTMGDFTEATVNTAWTFTALTGTLAKIQLLPTDPTPNRGPVVTNFSVLTAKRPGRATLFVTDQLGCTAPLEIDVVGQQLFIEFQNEDQSEFIEQGDSIQLRAWMGFRGAFDGANEVTNLAQWESDNTDVVTVTSPGGRVTAVGPGVANVRARYNTQVPETGELVSEGSLRIRVDELDGLTIGLDRETLDRLPALQRNAAYSSVALAVNQPEAAGRSITLEGEQIQLQLPVSPIGYATELDQIRAITNQLAADIREALNGDVDDNPATPDVQGIQVTTYADRPGALILQPGPDDPNDRIDITSTALPEELTVLPAFSSGIDLPPSETYHLMVLGEYDSGRTRLLSPTAVTWRATPVNILDDAALETALLKRELEGIGGTATVRAEFDPPSEPLFFSNMLVVNIAQGPAIDYVRRVGTSPITEGSRIHLLARVSDIDSVEDIQQIDVFLVRTNATTPQDVLQFINANPNSVFVAETFLEEVEPEAAPADGTPPPAPDTPPPAAPAAPAAPQFRNYEIPIEIPTSAQLFDGPYQLLFSIYDRANHPAHFVMPINIGPIALGDVDGDGTLSIIDVILAFRIANNTLTPPATTEQLQAANMDGVGNVSLLDVLLLFMQVSNPT